MREIAPIGLDCLHVYVPAVLGLLALGAGHHAQALTHLEHASSAARSQGVANPVVVPLWGDLVDARIRTGDRDGAEEAIRMMERSAAETGLVYPELVAARGRGMLATESDVAVACFGRARAAAQRCSMPFENARTLLREGEALRRLRQPARAREPLRHAIGTFTRLGARPWAERASHELDAAGGVGSGLQDQEPALDSLTPQEFQTARAVATGLSNAEVAAALFLSRKTVEAHLSRIYRKLGIRSRVESVHAVSAIERTGTSRS